MTKYTKNLIALVGAIVLATAIGYAQTFTLANTTLSGSISATQTTLVLASASASSGSSFGSAAVGQCLFIDAELMRITAVSSTTMTVSRATGSGGGGSATPHYTGAIIFRAACSAFQQAEPPLSGNWRTGGNVTCTAYPAPWINVKTANVWWCNTVNNQWSGTNFNQFTYNSVAIAQ